MDEKRTAWKSQAILFLISQCITLFGSALVQMAIIWYVTIQTSSGVWVAAFTICSYLPQFLISFAAGVWADRHSRKKLIIVSDSLIAFATFLMVLSIPHVTDKTVILGGLLVMSAIRSLGTGIQTPAVNAVIPQLVPEEQIMRYNGLNALMQSAVQFAAPAAAGVLLTINTLSSVLVIDIATAIAGIGLLSAVMIPKQTIQNEATSVFKEMKAGIKYTLSDKLIGKVLTAYGLFIFLCVPAGFLSQLFVSRVYGETYWYLSAAELAGFIGMTAGGLIMSIWGGFKNRVTTMSVGLAAFGSLAVGMGLSKHFAIYLTLMIIYGSAITIVQTAATTLIQEKAECPCRGEYSDFLAQCTRVFCL